MLLRFGDLSSQTRDQTRVSCNEVHSPNHWTAREFPGSQFSLAEGSLFQKSVLYSCCPPSTGVKVKVWKWKLLSRVQLFATPWTVQSMFTLQARILEWVAFPFSRQSSQPRDRTQVFLIIGRFFSSWATEKPKNTGVCSLSLVQYSWVRFFPTQESNRWLLHCRLILYQLSYQGRPGKKDPLLK